MCRRAFVTVSIPLPRLLPPKCNSSNSALCTTIDANGSPASSLILLLLMLRYFNVEILFSDYKITTDEVFKLLICNRNFCKCLFDLMASASSIETLFNILLLLKLSDILFSPKSKDLSEEMCCRALICNS